MSHYASSFFLAGAFLAAGFLAVAARAWLLRCRFLGGSSSFGAAPSPIAVISIWVSLLR